MSTGNVSDNFQDFNEYSGRRSRSAGSTSTFVPPVVLRVEGLIKIYGKRRVVDGVNFQVHKGEIVGLLGPNGAGKTTSFRMACGLINTNGGVVYLGSQDVTNWPMYRRSREGGMGYLPQDKSVFQKLSVQNNLLGVMEMLGIKRAVRKKRCEELLEKLQLTHLRYNYAGGLSGGERRRLEIARSLVSEPKVILLDEPFAAVDPITVNGIQEIIRQLAEEGISILITDHSVQDTLQITQRSYVIQAGKVLCHGTPQEVLSNPEARKVYFGENVNVGSLHSVPLHPTKERRSIDNVSEPFSDVEVNVGMDVEEETEKPRHSPAHRKHRKQAETDTVPSVSVPPAPMEGPAPAKKTEVRPGSRLTQTGKHKLPEPKAPTHPPVPALQTAKVDEGAVVQAERINRRQHAVSETRSRPIGRRLVPTSQEKLPERPLINSTSSKKVEKPEAPPMPTGNSTGPEEPAEGMSGIIRSLGSLIWKK